MDFIKLAGQRLRGIREKRGESQRMAAKGAGISSTTVSRMERGEEGYKLAMLFSLCHYYQVHPKTLFRPERKKKR